MRPTSAPLNNKIKNKNKNERNLGNLKYFLNDNNFNKKVNKKELNEFSSSSISDNINIVSDNDRKNSIMTLKLNKTINDKNVIIFF